MGQIVFLGLGKPFDECGVGSGGGGVTQLSNPVQILMDNANGILYVQEWGNHRVSAWKQDGTPVTVYGAGLMNDPRGMDLDGLGYLYVADSGNNQVLKFKLSDGSVVATFGTGAGSWPGQLSYPEGIAFDQDKNLWVAEGTNKRFSVFQKDGTFVKAVTTVGGTLNDPYQIRIKDGAIWELDRGSNQLQVFDTQGNILGSYASGGSNEGQISNSLGFDFDTVGGFYIGDYNNNRVVRYDPCGSVGTAIPTATGSATPTVTATVTATTTCSAIDYTYDNNGNLTTESRCGAATTYTYDSDNRLTSVVAGGVTTSMVYDYDGNLVQKTVGGQVTRYVYAGGPAPVAEINVTANTEKDFIQANGRTWGVMEATSNTYFHHDAIGSVVALSNDSGQVTDTYEYEPFGKVLDHQGTSTNDYLFVGGYGVRKLNDTLDTMGVRQYSGQVGRFTTQDPLNFNSGDLNLFRYVLNSPHGGIDPTGKRKFVLDMGPSITVGIGPVGAGYFTAYIQDVECGDITPYQIISAGGAAGSRWSIAFGESSKNFDSDADWSGAFGGEGNISAGSVQILSLVSTRVKVPQGPVVVFDGWLSVSIGWGGFYFETTWIPGPTLFK
jgi:RHS repeat-associated protein